MEEGRGKNGNKFSLFSGVLVSHWEEGSFPAATRCGGRGVGLLVRNGSFSGAWVPTRGRWVGSGGVGGRFRRVKRGSNNGNLEGTVPII